MRLIFPLSLQFCLFLLILNLLCTFSPLDLLFLISFLPTTSQCLVFSLTLLHLLSFTLCIPTSTPPPPPPFLPGFTGSVFDSTQSSCFLSSLSLKINEGFLGRIEAGCEEDCSYAAVLTQFPVIVASVCVCMCAFQSGRVHKNTHRRLHAHTHSYSFFVCLLSFSSSRVSADWQKNKT